MKLVLTFGSSSVVPLGSSTGEDSVGPSPLLVGAAEARFFLGGSGVSSAASFAVSVLDTEVF